jgi:hemolysin-activating ACP:hemolysin acyltransferase
VPAGGGDACGEGGARKPSPGIRRTRTCKSSSPPWRPSLRSRLRRRRQQSPRNRPDAAPAPRPAGAQGNGAAAQPLAAAEQASRPVRANPVSTAFGDMVALLTRSAAHKHFSLADLEWLLLPPVALNQFALADAKLPNGQTVLAGFVLWARVSPEVDAKLTKEPRYPIRLHPSEWRSGDIFWIIDAAGDPRMIQNIIGQLAKNIFGEKQFKMLKFQTGSTVLSQEEKTNLTDGDRPFSNNVQ